MARHRASGRDPPLHRTATTSLSPADRTKSNIGPCPSLSWPKHFVLNASLFSLAPFAENDSTERQLTLYADPSALRAFQLTAASLVARLLNLHLHMSGAVKPRHGKVEKDCVTVPTLASGKRHGQRSRNTHRRFPALGRGVVSVVSMVASRR